MNRKALISAATVTAAVAASLLVAAPAQAAPAACNAGQGCTYEDVNYGRGHINFLQNVKKFGDIGYWVPTLHVWTDNAASAAYNYGQTNRAVYLFDKAGYSGPPDVTINPSNGVANLGSKGLNDKVSSACFAGFCK